MECRCHFETLIVAKLGFFFGTEGMGDEVGTSNGDGTECTEGLKSEAVNNGMAIGIGNDGAEWSSGGSEGFQTYKRRKYVRLCTQSKAREDGRVCVEASQLVKQVFTRSLFNANFYYDCNMGLLYFPYVIQFEQL